MADNSEDLAGLKAELAALRAEVTALDRELHHARTHIDLTMRGQLRCRACNSRRIAHVPRVADRAHMGLPLPMTLVSESGQLEAYVCTRCGVVEWWVIDPGALEPQEGQRAMAAGNQLVILDGEVTGPKDPYR